jgi:FAD dependent oxidoreductase TIGR03364
MLQNQFGVQFFFDEPALKVSNGTITTTRQEISAQLAIICPGANFKILHPDFFTRHGLTQTTLQMLRAEPMNRERRLGTMLAGGLTLGHYASFESCPSILKLREFHQAHYQPYVERGIHVMASQHADPEITIGDTHVYGIDTPPFGEEFADELIMDYLAKMVSTEGWRITSRWQGTYSKHRDNPLLTEQLDAKTLIAPSPGGAGMTLSFGFAERNLAQQQLGQIIHV